MRRSKGYWGYSEEYLEAFMRIFAVDEEYLRRNPMRLAHSAGSLVGVYSFKFYSEQNQWELDLFFIDVPFIRRGWGEAMWRACCQTASELDVKEFLIWSDVHAGSFYQRMGAAVVGQKPSAVDPRVITPVLKYLLLP